MQALSARRAFTEQPDNLVAPEVWESRWQEIRYPLRLDFRSRDIRALADFFTPVLPLGEKAFIEIGCGASAWMPFFAERMGYKVYGIDMSPTGVLIARKNLEACKIDGHILEGDVFDPGLLHAGQFDIVFSLGFIEHFPDTDRVVSRLSSLLKPGGLMLTVVPNMQGLPGLVQKLADRAVFEQHVVMDDRFLERVHRDAGLEPVRGPEYVGGFDLWTANWGTVLRGRSRAFRRVFGKLGAAVNLATNLGLRLCGIPDGRWVSQKIVIAARKREDAGQAR